MTKRGNRYSEVLFVGTFFALYALAYRGFLGSYVFAYGDFPAFPLRATDALKAFFSSWQPLSRGVVLPQSLVLFFEGILIFLSNGNAIVAQKVFLFAPMPIAFVAMNFFLSRIVASRFPRLVASFVYSVNPASIGIFIGGAVGAIYAQALFPLLLISLFNLRKEVNQIRNLLLFAFLVTLVYTFGGPTILVVFLLPAVFILLFKILAEKNRKRAFTITAILFASLLLFLALTLPYSYQIFAIGAQFLPGATPAEALKIRLADVKAMYGLSTIINVVRLGAEDLSFLGYVDSDWALLGFILPLLSFSSLLLRHDRKRLGYVTGFSIAAVSIILFIWLTHLRLTIELFKIFPFLLAFPNDSRLVLMLSLAYSPLIAITIDNILCGFEVPIARSRVVSVLRRTRYLKGLLLCTIIIASLAGYSWPFFTGDMAFSAAGRPINQSTIPAVFYEVGKWLDARRASEGFFRTLWLPFDYEPTELSLRWIDPYSLSLPLGSAQYASSLMIGYVRFVLDSLCTERTKHIGALLAPLNVKYIIVNKASVQTGHPRIMNWYETPYAMGDPNDFARILNRQSDLRSVVNEANFLVYENEEFIPHISVYSDIIFVATSDNRTPLGLTATLNDVLGPRGGKQLLVFKEHLSSEQSRLLLRHSSVIVLSDPTAETYAEYANVMNASQALILVYSFLAFSLRASAGPIAFLFPEAKNLVVAGTYAYYLEGIAKKHIQAGAIPSILIEGAQWTDKETETWIREHGLTLVPRGPRPEELASYLPTPAYLEKNIFSIRDELYRIGLKASGDGTASFMIDGKVVRVAKIKDRFGWYESEPFYLSQGVHNMSVVFTGNLTIMHDMALYSVFDSPSKLLYSFQSHNVSETEYQVQVESNRPAFIVLGEPFHAEWSAYTGREKLNHFPAFGLLNGFYLGKNGTNQVTISFEGQKIKNLAISIWAISWAILIAGIIYTFRKSIKSWLKEIEKFIIRGA